MSQNPSDTYTISCDPYISKQIVELSSSDSEAFPWLYNYCGGNPDQQCFAMVRIVFDSANIPYIGDGGSVTAALNSFVRSVPVDIPY